MNQGSWVVLHFVQPMPLENNGNVHRLIGYLEADPRLAGYKLTKMVVKHTDWIDGYQGTQTTIHTGTWLIAPQFVWMVEYEQSAPTAGFVREE